MKDNYDFSKGIKNPYIDMLKNGCKIIIHYGPQKRAKVNRNLSKRTVKIERLMSRRYDGFAPLTRK